MAGSRRGDLKSRNRRQPAKSPDSRENQLIDAAVRLAEKQLTEGTASAQVITHYLKLASSQSRLEREKLANENLLLKAKTEALQSAKRVEELYADALEAMRSYRGQEPKEEEDDLDE